LRSCGEAQGSPSSIVASARLVLVGPSWRSLIAAFAGELVVDGQDLALPVLVDDVDAVIPAVRGLLALPTPPLGARG